MVTADYSDKMPEFFDKALKGEKVIVTGSTGDKFVILSLKDYEEIEKNMNNSAYLEKLDRGFKQIEEGSLQYHDLIEVD